METWRLKLIFPVLNLPEWWITPLRYWYFYKTFTLVSSRISKFTCIIMIHHSCIYRLTPLSVKNARALGGAPTPKTVGPASHWVIQNCNTLIIRCVSWGMLHSTRRCHFIPPNCLPVSARFGVNRMFQSRFGTSPTFLAANQFPKGIGATYWESWHRPNHWFSMRSQSHNWFVKNRTSSSEAIRLTCQIDVV